MVGLTKVNKNVMEPVNVTQVVTNDDPQQNLEQVIGDGLVHVTGNETIAGVKTFEDDVKVVDSVVFTNSPSVGIKVDRDVPNWAWADLTSTIVVDGASPSTSPTYAVYRGNIRQHQFDVNDVVYCTFHIPHDYATGTNLFIHTHWSHNVVGAGNVTWEFEVSYAKGHNQAAFGAPVTVSVTQAASTTQYQHMIAEVQLSDVGSPVGKLSTDNIETDGIILVAVKLSANTTGQAPFLHFCDIHYQSTGIGTKQKAPNFYL